MQDDLINKTFESLLKITISDLLAEYAYRMPKLLHIIFFNSLIININNNQVHKNQKQSSANRNNISSLA
jgi:hypothetical protein